MMNNGGSPNTVHGPPFTKKTMIQNYFKTALRNLWKTRGYSFLNIFGLAVGIAATALIFLWIADETGYDSHFPDKEHIYITKLAQGGDAVSGLLGPAMKADIPGIKYAARANWSESYLFTAGNNGIYQNGHIVDPEFMDIFSLEFVEGSRAMAMDSPKDLVISQSAAKRLFGNVPALGKSVRVNDKEDYMVSGVVKDLPTNSTVQFDWLVPFETFEKENGWVRDWRNAVVMTYVRLEPSANLADVNRMLNDLISRETGNAIVGNFLYPMERWRLYNSFDSDGNEQEGRMKYVRLFGLIAWVVLVIACINFMNLATARSEKRAKEVSMRKVVGASKASLVGRFLGESIILTAIAGLLAIGLVYLTIGAFNSLVEKELVVDLFKPANGCFLIGIVLVCGILSGIYPAFYLSAFNPIATLKGVRQKAGVTGFIRRGLVVLQYTASITLIICTAVIFQQIRHVKGRDLGFERSQVVTVPLRGEMTKRYDAIKQQLMATGNVESTGLSSGSVLHIGVRTSMDWVGKDPDEQVTLCYQWADDGFIPTMGLELMDGRNFRPGMLGDSSSIIINEAFAKLISTDGKAAGQTVYWDGDPHLVAGVVKDFIYNDVYAPAAPVFFRPFNLSGGLLNIKTSAGADLPKAISQIEEIMKANNPGYPFEYGFLDEQFNEIFKSEMLIQQLAGVFAVLSIIISCLSLFGLAAFTAERRTKEMGIRKVLGASIASLVGLLNREFVVLVLVSCTVAFPIAWWVMSDWLGNYEYRTDLHWWVFGLAGLGALLIALFTVSSQAIRAALANPVESLRDE